jgi:hypothetical protein
MDVTTLRKLLLIFLMLLFVSGCGFRRYDGAAAHLGDPVTIQILAQGHQAVIIREKADIRKLMNILAEINVRELNPDEEIDIIFRQGKTAGAIELRFKDIDRNIYKALFLKDGSVLVVDGVRGSAERRYVYLSAPGQTALDTFLKSYLQ